VARERGRTPRRLDQPREVRRQLVRTPSYDRDAIARFLGTGRFLVYMTIFISFWLLWNNVVPGDLRFDPYTHTFLTLLLSIQASYAAPLILLAQNRQADRDRVQYEQDRARAERTIADTEYLTRELASLRISVGEVATRDFVRSELRALLEELDARAAAEDSNSAA
jgi:uncharacterized membrane protein